MKPVLWMALIAVGALSLYVAQSPEDDLAPTIHRDQGAGPTQHRTRGADASGATEGRRMDKGGQMKATEPDASMWVSLLPALQRWQQRSQDAQPWPAQATPSRLAWAAQTPPPPPPVQAPPPAPAPPPMAPPFPHAWVGRYVDNTVRAVVAGPAQTWVVQAKDVMDGQWRVDAIEAHQMRLTYLPLQQSQTVTLK